jgi:hypothetical protein
VVNDFAVEVDGRLITNSILFDDDFPAVPIFSIQHDLDMCRPVTLGRLLLLQIFVDDDDGSDLHDVPDRQCPGNAQRSLMVLPRPGP